MYFSPSTSIVTLPVASSGAVTVITALSPTTSQVTLTELSSLGTTIVELTVALS